MGTGTGKGKSILFGEHFVVYGIPAIATGIANEAVVHVNRSKGLGWTLDDRRPAVPGYKEKKVDEQRVSIENVLRFCKVDTSKEGITETKYNPTNSDVTGLAERNWASKFKNNKNQN